MTPVERIVVEEMALALPDVADRATLRARTGLNASELARTIQSMRWRGLVAFGRLTATQSALLFVPQGKASSNPTGGQEVSLAGASTHGEQSPDAPAFSSDTARPAPPPERARGGTGGAGRSINQATAAPPVPSSSTRLPVQKSGLARMGEGRAVAGDQPVCPERREVPAVTCSPKPSSQQRFEELLAKVARGEMRVVEVRDIRRSSYDTITLGGVVGEII